MFKSSFFAVSIALLAISAAALPSYKERLTQLFDNEKIPSSVSDAACIVEHCPKLAAECISDKDCVSAILCVLGCVSEPDPTPQKLTQQNCTNKCAFTYGEGKVFQDFLGCVTDNKCVALPPVPSTCKGATAKPTKQLSTKDLEGKWWVQRGYNKVYDCYPCQTMTYSRKDATTWSYHPVFDTYLVNNSLMLVTNQFIDMPDGQPGQPIDFTYRNLGILLTVKWWVLDKADDNSWVISYYCGNALEWNYEGAVVLSKAKNLDQSAYVQIASSYKQSVGLDLSDFCPINNSGSQCTQN